MPKERATGVGTLARNDVDHLNFACNRRSLEKQKREGEF